SPHLCRAPIMMPSVICADVLYANVGAQQISKAMRTTKLPGHENLLLFLKREALPSFWFAKRHVSPPSWRQWGASL
ncbi:MAG: hypothetical protein ACLFQ6_12790, partial [Candidatus Sumerlaeia bacterium]